MLAMFQAGALQFLRPFVTNYGPKRAQNSEPPAPKRSKLDHEPPVTLHDNLPVLPDAVAEGHRRRIFCEVFAGAGASAVQPNGLPVDGPRNEHKPECQIRTLDLVDTHAQQLLLDSLRRTLPRQAMHVALPCGTGSGAREKPVPAHLIAQGAPQPRQLRNAEHPLGLPGLNTHEQAKVTSANALAHFTIELFALAVATGSVFSIENPSNFWMWDVFLWYVKALGDHTLLQHWLHMSAVQFSNCAHGGERPKQPPCAALSKPFGTAMPRQPCSQAIPSDKTGQYMEVWYSCWERVSLVAVHAHLPSFAIPFQAKFHFRLRTKPTLGHVQTQTP